MNQTTISIRILELVALLLPATGAFFKLFLENNKPRSEFELTDVFHQLQTSILMVLTIGSILVAGFFAIGTLYFSSESSIVKWVAASLSSGLIGIAILLFEWYKSNVKKYREITDEEIIPLAENQLEEVERFEELISDIDLDEMTYLEKKELRQDLEDLGEDFVRFDPQKPDSIEGLYTGLQEYLPQRKKELKEAIEESENLKETVAVFPTFKSLIQSVRNPINTIYKGRIIISGLVVYIVSKALLQDILGETASIISSLFLTILVYETLTRWVRNDGDSDIEIHTSDIQ